MHYIICEYDHQSRSLIWQGSLSAQMLSYTVSISFCCVNSDRVVGRKPLLKCWCSKHCTSSFSLSHHNSLWSISWDSASPLRKTVPGLSPNCIRSETDKSRIHACTCTHLLVCYWLIPIGDESPWDESLMELKSVD